MPEDAARREGPSEKPRTFGRLTDARGRVVAQLNPVKLHLLNRTQPIPPDILSDIADELLPGARRQRLGQIICVCLSVGIILGGNFVYFGTFKLWQRADPVMVTIYLLQALLIFGAPFLAYRIARAKFAERITTVMFKHHRCPHCGYDLRGSPTNPADGTTACPECGCNWQLTAEKPQPPERRMSPVPLLLSSAFPVAQ
jgi:hypothetical protein